MMILSVSDVERLAKAGVKIEIREVLVQPDCTEVPAPSYPPPSSLNDSFWQRWQRANPPNPMTFGMTRPWDIYATEYGDKVYVYVAPPDGEPFILEDSRNLFPSDALMAALHLREKSK